MAARARARRFGLGTLGVLAALSGHRVAHATEKIEGTSLDVVHSIGSERCPGEGVIADALRRTRAEGSHADTSALAPLHLTVSLSSNIRYVATVIASGRKSGSRDLSAPGPLCEGLVAKVVSALSDLMDADTPVSPSVNPPPVPSDSLVGTTAWITGGAGIDDARPQHFALELVGEAELRVTRWTFGASGFWIKPENVDAPPGGSVAVSLAGGGLRGCYAPLRRRHIGEFSLCALTTLGSLHGAASSYPFNRSEYRPWFSIGVGADLRGDFTPKLGWDVFLAGETPLTKDDFTMSVDGRPDVVFRTSTIAASLTLRLTVRL